MAFHLSGRIFVPAAALPAVRAALPEHVSLTRAEPGCVSFAVIEHEGGAFSVDETFTDFDAFEAHQQRAAGTHWAHVTSSATRKYKTWED